MTPIVPDAPELLTPEQRDLLARQKANHKRQTRERAIVRGLIRALKAAGWLPHSVYDGEAREPTTTETAMMEAVFAVDAANAWFSKHSHKRCTVSLVLGNGEDIIADHSDPAGDPGAFVATVDAYMRAEGMY